MPRMITLKSGKQVPASLVGKPYTAANGYRYQVNEDGTVKRLGRATNAAGDRMVRVATAEDLRTLPRGRPGGGGGAAVKTATSTTRTGTAKTKPKGGGKGKGGGTTTRTRTATAVTPADRSRGNVARANAGSRTAATPPLPRPRPGSAVATTAAATTTTAPAATPTTGRGPSTGSFSVAAGRKYRPPLSPTDENRVRNSGYSGKNSGMSAAQRFGQPGYKLDWGNIVKPLSNQPATRNWGMPEKGGGKPGPHDNFGIPQSHYAEDARLARERAAAKKREAAQPKGRARPPKPGGYKATQENSLNRQINRLLEQDRRNKK